MQQLQGIATFPFRATAPLPTEQARMLRLLRCDELQGFLFSRPVPFDELTALLQRQ